MAEAHPALLSGDEADPRTFRLDRMTAARCLAEALPLARRLLAEWRAGLTPDRPAGGRT